MTMKSTKHSTLEIIAFIIIVLGLIFAVFALFKFNNYFCITDGQRLDIDDSSGIASFIADIISPIWTLASVLLFYVALKYQRYDLNMQREELVKTREEFEINRITEIIFKQADRIESLLDNVKIDGRSGHSAIERLGFYLDPFETNILPVTDISVNSSSVISSYEIVLKNIPYILTDLEIIFNFFIPVSNSVDLVVCTLKTSSLNNDRQNELKNLLVQYIGNDKIKYFRWISNTLGAYVYWYSKNKLVPRADNYDQLVRLWAAVNNVLELCSKPIEELESRFRVV